MFKRNVALLGQRHSVWQRSPGRFLAPDGEQTYPLERHNRGVRVPAAGAGTSGSYGGNAGKQAGGRGGDGAAGGSGGGVEGGRAPSEPIVLTPEEATRRKKSGPLPRSSYRRRKDKAEESRRQRAEYLAELSAASKRARVSYVGGSPPAPLGPRVALVDGYNVIHASGELSRLADFRIQDARHALNRMAVAFAEVYGMRVYVVYDAMGSHSTTDRLERLGPQALAVYSVASEADTYIGQAAAHWKRQGAREVMVVSNDRYVQDLAADRDYVIYPVNLDAWLDQAHRATLSPPQPGGGGSGLVATADWLSRAGAGARRGAADGPGGADGDEYESGEDSGTTSEGRRRAVLRSSRELHDELLWLASSSSEEDEMEAGEMEFEELEVDYLAALEDDDYYTAGGWSGGEYNDDNDDKEGEGQVEKAGSELGREEAAGTAPLGIANPGSGDLLDSCSGSGPGQQQQQQHQMAGLASGSAAPTALVATHTPPVGGAATEGTRSAPSLPPPEPSPASSASNAAAAAAAPAASPAVTSPPPPAQAPVPPASVGRPASKPVSGLSGLLGKGGKSKLAGLVKRATQDLDVKP